MKISFKHGFTLIELMVVMAIIAILTAVVLSNIGQSKMKARDGKRVSDLAQIQLALELYFDRCNAYPGSLDLTNSNTTCATNSNIKLGNYITAIPTDPITKVMYDYSGSGNPVVDYVLRSKLETSNQSLSDDVDGTQLTLDCSDSPNYYYCVKPK